MSEHVPDYLEALRLADELAPLHEAALPKDAPGAWIRAAIEERINDALEVTEEG